jgi:hypothetical protein
VTYNLVKSIDNWIYPQKNNYNFHRPGAEVAESDYFLFAVERPANKKTQALRAKQKSELRVAQFRIPMSCMLGLKCMNCRFIFCHRLIVFHLLLLASRFGGASQKQMKRKVSSALLAPLQ